MIDGADLTTNGWGRAEVIRGFEGDGGLDLSQCGGTPASQSIGYAGLLAWMYRGSQTEGLEMVVAFDDIETTGAYAGTYARTVTRSCPQTLGGDWRLERTLDVHPDGVSSAGAWTVSDRSSGQPIHRLIAVVATTDRVAVLHLSSTTSDPSRTVDVDGLLASLSKRLKTSASDGGTAG